MSTSHSAELAPCRAVLDSCLAIQPMVQGLATQRQGPPDGGPEAQEFLASIRALYQQLFWSATIEGEAVRIVGITSCHRHEGKSTVAAHLATVAAESRKVLLASVDLTVTPRPAASRPRIAGGAASMSERTGPAVVQRHELLAAVSPEFDLVVVDLPSLDDPGILEWAPRMDGIVLVIESDRVRWQVAARGVSLLEQAGAQVLGAVINKRQDHIPEWLYRRL